MKIRFLDWVFILCCILVALDIGQLAYAHYPTKWWMVLWPIIAMIRSLECSIRGD